jgi:hypothetical protein
MFEGSPAPGIATYATLGLSSHVLAMPTGRQVRQEILLALASNFTSEEMAKLLAHVAEGIIRQHRALLRGEVLPMDHAIAPSSGCSSLYVAIPVAFPDGLGTCSDTDPPTVFVWLVPVHSEEAAFVSQFGWSEFEERLEQANPDLFDLERGSIA